MAGALGAKITTTGEESWPARSQPHNMWTVVRVLVRPGPRVSRPRGSQALVGVDDLVAEGEQRHRYEFDVGQPERYPDDRQELRDRRDDVPERQPPAGEDQPDHVADPG